MLLFSLASSTQWCSDRCTGMYKTMSNFKFRSLLLLLFYLVLYNFLFILQTASDWLYVYPKGFKNVLLYLKEKYEDPLIYITENGNSKKTNFIIFEI